MVRIAQPEDAASPLPPPVAPAVDPTTNLVESPGKDQQIMVSVAVEWLAPLTLLERAGVGAYMKPRDDDDVDEDEGDAARDARQRRVVQAYDVEVQRRELEAAAVG